MAERLSMRAYARHRKERKLSGGTHRSVSKAISSERIAEAVGDDGLIDPELADRLWEENKSRSAPPREPDQEPTAPKPPANTSQQDYLVGKARHTIAKAAEAELALAKKRGEVIPTEVYERRFSSLLNRLGKNLDGIPGGWTPRLASCGADPEEIHLALQHLVNELRRAIMRPSSDSDTSDDAA